MRYYPPVPRSMEEVMRRLEKARKGIKRSTLIKLVHGTKARLKRIIELNGKVIPKGWKIPPEDRCQCDICKYDSCEEAEGESDEEEDEIDEEDL